VNALFLVQNIVPYHSARINQFANTYKHSTYVLESNCNEEFAVLKEYESNPRFDILRLKSYSYEELRQLVLENSIGYIFCSGYSFYASILAIRIAEELNHVYIFACCESNYFDKKRFWPTEWFKSFLVSNYSGFLVGSLSHGEYVRRLYAGTQPLRIMHGYDVVDNEHFAPTEAVDYRREDKPEIRFITVSRFEAKKNLIRLIHAFGRAVSDYKKYGGCKERNTGMHLYIVGTGSLETKIKREIAKLNLGKFITLTGPVSYARLPGLYGSCDVLIHPSTSEQWGLVINEAMSAGLAILCSTQTGASKLLVDTDNGIIFDAYSIHSIATAISKIMTMPKAKISLLGQNSMKKIQTLAPLSEFSSGALALIQSNLPKKSKADFRIRLVSAVLHLRMK